MKETKKIGLLFAVFGLIMMTVNYLIHQYLFIFIGTIMLFIGIAIPIFFEDKKQSIKKQKNGDVK